jgi:polysaccharide biosynthesis protein PelC
LRMGHGFREEKGMKKLLIGCIVLIVAAACSSGGVYDVYRDETADFGLIRTVAIMPLTNLTRDEYAPERVRDTLYTMLIASSGIYIVPPGEVARAISTASITAPTTPTSADAVKLAAMLKADVIMTGVIREYGEVRSVGTASSIVSVSFKMMEGQNGRIIWSASSTRGGIGFKERLLGGGGEPMNIITEKAINDILNKLFK